MSKFLKLTKQEEEAGLYEDTSRIGTKHFWEELLLKKKLEINLLQVQSHTKSFES